MSLHPRRGRMRRWRLLWPGVLVAVVLWVLLWGDVSWANVLGGLVVGTVVLLVLPMPPTAFRGRVHPWRLLLLLARFHWDLLRASLEVAVLAFHVGRTPHGAIVGVRLCSSNDLYMTIVAELSSLVPGTLVLDAHRITGTLYLHVLDVALSGGIEQVRRDTLALEERVLRALASREELAEAGLGPGASPVVLRDGRGRPAR